ncbi:MAG: 2-amino-4-hydroxy-6-hydroxymethyldihydropteridine diphosphokinase [Bacteroidota bacterium]
MIWIGLGTNQGDRVGYMVQAVKSIQARGLTWTRLSALYETAPWGIEEQPAFLNAVGIVETHRSPLELLDELLDIEEEMGRVRVQKWGPRIIDLDIIDYQGERWDHPRLKLPHPYAHSREFVLAPMRELMPDFKLGGHDLSVLDYLLGLSSTSFLKWPHSDWTQIQEAIRS